VTRKLSVSLCVFKGRLQNLEILSLFNNEIEGQIPNALFDAETLKIVLLNSNKLSGKLS
jgi:hypothetical protein